MDPVFGGGSPFTSHIGVEVQPMGWGIGCVTLKDDDHMNNHVGSRHAGALFAAGDAAGAALIEATFPAEVAHNLRVEISRIEYESMAKGPLEATARLAGDRDSDELVSAVAAGLLDSFVVSVDITDQGRRTVSTMTLRYGRDGGSLRQDGSSRNTAKNRSPTTNVGSSNGS